MPAAVTVVARCQDCQEVRLPHTECRVLYCRDSGVYTVAYPCPQCGRRDVTHANRATIIEFVMAGTRITSWSLPDELRDPARESSRNARDDLLDMLADPTWVDTLEHTAPPR
jgi:hypothetical protein